MKSSESSMVSTQNSISEIKQNGDFLINTIKEEILTILGKIKELLKDDQKFFTTLISKCLFIGKDIDRPIYWNDIDSLLRQEYPELLKHEYGRKLLKFSSLLCDELCLDRDLINMNKLLEHTPQNEYNNVRNMLDDVVLEYCDINREDIGLIGEIFSYET